MGTKCERAIKTEEYYVDELQALSWSSRKHKARTKLRLANNGASGGEQGTHIAARCARTPAAPPAQPVLAEITEREGETD
jgi:hypothetical protein